MGPVNMERPSNTVGVTVILCTYNRCGILAKALSSIAASKLPDGVGWEVLVVDNNSTDRTHETVEEFCRQYPERFRYLPEPRPGKSYALNSGIRSAQGEILAFMDDDVIVEPAWLQNLTLPLLRYNAWSGSGGRILPGETVPIPFWLSLDGPYGMGGMVAALFDLGDKPGELDRPPYGTNMAYRKAMFEKYGDFRTDLGPSPDKAVLRPNEDTEFGRRIMAAGERLRYEPSAIVYHPISEDRLTKQYFLGWLFDCGRAATRELGRRPDILGIPRRYLTIPKIVLTMLTPRALQWAFASTPQRRFYHKCFVWMAAGQIQEIRRQAREADLKKDDTIQIIDGSCNSKS